MGRSVYVEVDGVQYNKKQFGAKWSEIVGSYEQGVSLGESDSEFFRHVCLKIDRFRKILLKGGVAEFRIVRKEFNGKRVKGIVIVSPGSRSEVWVGKKYVMDRVFPRTRVPDVSKENRKNVLKALRSIIEPQIEVFRGRISRETVVKSSSTGKPIFGAYHVDHVYPFIRLVEEWCRENSLDLETIPVKCRGARCRLESVQMAESWFDYHALNSQFQILDASENIRKGAKYYGKALPSN
jgi:hypothetical protein